MLSALEERLYLGSVLIRRRERGQLAIAVLEMRQHGVQVPTVLPFQRIQQRDPVLDVLQPSR